MDVTKRQMKVAAFLLLFAAVLHDRVIADNVDFQTRYCVAGNAKSAIEGECESALGESNVASCSDHVDETICTNDIRCQYGVDFLCKDKPTTRPPSAPAAVTTSADDMEQILTPPVCWGKAHPEWKGESEGQKPSQEYIDMRPCQTCTAAAKYDSPIPDEGKKDFPPQMLCTSCNTTAGDQFILSAYNNPYTHPRVHTGYCTQPLIDLTFPTGGSSAKECVPQCFAKNYTKQNLIGSIESVHDKLAYKGPWPSPEDKEITCSQNCLAKTSILQDNEQKMATCSFHKFVNCTTTAKGRSCTTKSAIGCLDVRSMSGYSGIDSVVSDDNANASSCGDESCANVGLTK